MISLRQIQEIVRQYPAICHPKQIEPLGAAGGMSGAQFWRIESTAGTLALRRWPAEHPSAERLRFIHDVLFHAAGRGVSFLPVPIRSTAGESFLVSDGRLWELALWVPGAADYEQSPSPQKLAAAMKALATFHVAVQNFLAPGSALVAAPAPAVLRRLSRLRELSQDGTNRLAAAAGMGIWPELKPLAERFLATMPILLPRAIRAIEPLANLPLPLQPCIRDIWHDHVLFTGDVVTGIIDFGAIDIDTPATDITRLLGSLVADDEARWRAGESAYSDVRVLSADELRAVDSLDMSSSILAGCNWMQWIGAEGRQFEDRSRVVERYQRIVMRCEHAAAS